VVQVLSGNPFVLRFLEIGGRRGSLLVCAQIGSHPCPETGDGRETVPARSDLSHFGNDTCAMERR
jgi:hypothetical protein